MKKGSSNESKDLIDRKDTYPSCHLRLNVFFCRWQTRWDPIDDASHTPAMRFAVGHDTEVGSEC